jgi:hypothetical protein
LGSCSLTSADSRRNAKTRSTTLTLYLGRYLTFCVQAAMLDEQVGEDGQHVVGSEPSLWRYRQALTAVLVDDVQHPVLAAVFGDVLDEVVPLIVTVVGGMRSLVTISWSRRML